MTGIASDRDDGRPVRLLCQEELARRWHISPRTLERYRWLGEDPPFIKIGGAVRYRIEDIEAYEAKQRRAQTARPADTDGSS